MSGTPAATVHTACVCVRARATLRERTKETGRLEKGEGAGKRSKGQMIVFSCASTRLDICALCWVKNQNQINYFYAAAKLSFKGRRRQQHCPDRHSPTSKITFFIPSQSKSRAASSSSILRPSKEGWVHLFI